MKDRKKLEEIRRALFDDIVGQKDYIDIIIDQIYFAGCSDKIEECVGIIKPTLKKYSALSIDDIITNTIIAIRALEEK